MGRIVFRRGLALVLSWLLAIGLAWAAGDPPARVGRLAYVEDGVAFRSDRNDPGAAAVVNWPVTSGNVLDTRHGGRAEVWIGSTAYRLAPESRVEFSIVDDERVALRLERGSLTVSVLDRDQLADIEIATPGGQVRFQTPGRYRFDLFPDYRALTVQAGRAIIDSGRQVTPVVAGQRYLSERDGRDGLDAMAPEDNFDRWVAARENASIASTARRYVSPGMSGYQDLDAWGEWQSVPEYGVVWYPSGVGSDWAPYRYGRWAWVEPWGWTWIDAAPWGFAPFHYGRWVILGGRWAWVPGQHAARPVYAPALVGWAGRPDRRFNPARLPPGAWFPLGPREVYVPAYRHSPDYVRQMNRAHVGDGAAIDHALRRPDERRFMYRQQPGAVTSVPLEPRREFRPSPGREINREPLPGFNREPERELNREQRRDFRPMPPNEIRTEPRQRPAEVPSQPAPTLRIMPAPQVQPPTPMPAPTLQPPVQTAVPPASRPALPVVPPIAPPIQPAVPQLSSPQAVAPSPVRPAPERQREFREPHAMPQAAPMPSPVAPPAPQSVNPQPMPGSQMPGGQPHGGHEFRGGPRPEGQPAANSGGERRGERPARDRDEGHGPR